MKTITIDVIKGTADVHAVEGDVGVKVTITNTPQEWKNCTVFALLTQGSKSQHIKVIDNTFEIPSAFTDANKAFKFCVYAVGANASRDVRPSIWIRVADSDFTTEDIEITSQTLNDILMLQAQYTQYENAEEERAEAEEVRQANESERKEAEEVRQANESERKEAENNRKTELEGIQTRLSGAETDIDNLGECKVDKIDGKGLSEKDFTEVYKARLDRVYTEDGGGGIGRGVYVDIGGAVGSGAQSYSGGGAIGAGTIAGLGLAGGYHARTADENDIAIDAIQLGTGQNSRPKTLQIYNYTLMNADGRIPAERMAVTPITEIPTTLSPNQTYHFSETPASITFPSAGVADGDTIYLTFMTGETPPTIEFYTTNTTDIDIEIDANTGYEIYGKYFEYIGKWIVGYSEYTATVGDSA